ncbi:MAG: hypothetical protein RLP44_31135 [Aggregatilineales bacterium]
MAAVQRIRQGLRALFAFSQDADLQLAETYLNDAQLELFKQMKHGEQLHSLNVLRDVLAQAEDTPRDLAIAALLHDSGKIRYPLAIWQKTLAVLMRAGSISLYRRMSTGDPRNPFKRACVVAERHPVWSSELVMKTNASERTLWLVTHHADSLTQWDSHPHSKLLKRLKDADDAN